MPELIEADYPDRNAARSGEGRRDHRRRAEQRHLRPRRRRDRRVARPRRRARRRESRSSEPPPRPSLASAWVERQGRAGPLRRARIRIAFPPDNIGANLPTLAATVAGNLYDLGEVTGLRLTAPRAAAGLSPHASSCPALGVAGTRDAPGVDGRPLFGTIIKPNVGLRTRRDRRSGRDALRGRRRLHQGRRGAANPAHAPLAERIPAVMARVRRYRERTGRDVMVAFNITDEHRRDAPPCRAGRAGRRQLRHGQHELGAASPALQSAAPRTRRSRSTATATAIGVLVAPSRARHGLPALPDALSPGRRRPHARPRHRRQVRAVRRRGRAARRRTA